MKTDFPTAGKHRWPTWKLTCSLLIKSLPLIITVRLTVISQVEIIEGKKLKKDLSVMKISSFY